MSLLSVLNNFGWVLNLSSGNVMITEDNIGFCFIVVQTVPPEVSAFHVNKAGP